MESTKSKKILSLVLDTFIISVTIMIVFLSMGGHLSAGEIIKQLLPTTFSNNWFVTCYIIIYAIHGWLNKVIKTISKRVHFDACIVMIMMYCVINFVLRRCYEFNGLVGFSVIYFITAFVKLYCPRFSTSIKDSRRLIIDCIVGCLLLILFTNQIGFLIPIAQNKMLHWTTYMNLFFILIGIGAVFGASAKPFQYNTKTNRFASTTLLIYLIHENYIIREYVRPMLFQIIYTQYGYDYIVLITITFALLFYFISMGIGYLYANTIRKYIQNITKVLDRIILKFEESIWVACCRILK